jgi:hypothetical protein
MIDTLKLKLVDYSVTNDSSIIVEPSPYDYSNNQKLSNYDLFVDSDGVITSGKKAYYNHDKFNVSILPSYSLKKDSKEIEKIFSRKNSNASEVYQIKTDAELYNQGCFVQTSLPHFNNENNFNSLVPREEKKVLNQLEKSLKSIGIKTNIWNSLVSRLDTFINIETNEIFSAYADIFEVLKLSRLEKFEYAGTTFLFRNGQRQICIYDKIRDMLAKSKDSDYYAHFPKHVMRIENRYMRTRKIKSIFDRKQDQLYSYNLNEIYKNYDFIKQNYKNEIEKTIFSYDAKDILGLSRDYILDRLESYRLMFGSKNFFNLFYFDRGTSNLMQFYNNDLDLLLSDFETAAMKWEKYNNRMFKSRLFKKINDSIFRLKMMEKNKSFKFLTNAELYEELRSKFYKLVA